MLSLKPQYLNLRLERVVRDCHGKLLVLARLMDWRPELKGSEYAVRQAGGCHSQWKLQKCQGMNGRSEDSAGSIPRDD